MTAQPQISHAIETVCRAWNMPPHRDLRIPEPTRHRPVQVDAIWTDYGRPPLATNIAFIVQSTRSKQEVSKWRSWFQRWPIRGGLIVSNETLILHERDPESGSFTERAIPHSSLGKELSTTRSRLFTPKALAYLKTGQLSLADMADVTSEQSFAFMVRHRAQLDRALRSAIEGALGEITTPTNGKSKQAQTADPRVGHLIRVAIAYMAARILEDKGFFGSEKVKAPTADPRELLDLTVSRANGFFRKAVESLSHVSDDSLQHLSLYLGAEVSFALVDDRDVGGLYERAVKELPKEFSNDEHWGDLQRYYTPVAIANQMLDLLPLERLRPEERVIFDPAAGSGSLLMAATSRLAKMTDVVESAKSQDAYLASHVVGNDLDQHADLVMHVRYRLAQQTLGNVPYPAPKVFWHRDYNSISKKELKFKPRVVIANPPFMEDGREQLAALFVEKALSWLDAGAQFAFVLPQSFITNRSHGVPAVRRQLSELCQIFDVWQYPEGIVGLDARQSVCVVLGQVGKPRVSLPTVARAVFSGADRPAVRDGGFLGSAWTASLGSEDWQSITAPDVPISVPTIPLGELFYVFSGVNPGNRRATYKPLPEQPDDIPCKRYWQLSWRGTGRLWANPARVDPAQRWIRYGDEYLEGTRAEDAHLFDLHKVLIGRTVNRGAQEPLAAHLDTTGFCVDSNVFCLIAADEAGKASLDRQGLRCPTGWETATAEERRLWLLGLLASSLLNAKSLVGRNARVVTAESICRLPLPLSFSHQIVDVTRRIIQREQQGEPVPHPDPLRQELDAVVANAYGSPQHATIARTGGLPGLHSWRTERRLPSVIVVGQVLDVTADQHSILLSTQSLAGEDCEGWIRLPPEMPGWALDGSVFEAELSKDVETFEQLAERPEALKRFRHAPRPYLTTDELASGLLG